MLTAGSSEVIKLSDGGAVRTNGGGAGHHLSQPVSSILVPSLDEEHILGLRYA